MDLAVAKVTVFEMEEQLKLEVKLPGGGVTASRLPLETGSTEPRRLEAKGGLPGWDLTFLLGLIKSKSIADGMFLSLMVSPDNHNINRTDAPFFPREPKNVVGLFTTFLRGTLKVWCGRRSMEDGLCCLPFLRAS